MNSSFSSHVCSLYIHNYCFSSSTLLLSLRLSFVVFVRLRMEGNNAAGNGNGALNAAQNGPATPGMVLFAVNQLHRMLRSYANDATAKFNGVNERLDSLNQFVLDLGVQMNGVEDKIGQNAAALCPNCRAARAVEDAAPTILHSQPSSPTVAAASDAPNPWLPNREGGDGTGNPTA